MTVGINLDFSMKSVALRIKAPFKHAMMKPGASVGKSLACEIGYNDGTSSALAGKGFFALSVTDLDQFDLRSSQLVRS